MKKDGDSHTEIAATLLLNSEIVDEIHKLQEDASHADLAKAIRSVHEKNRATLNPQFMQHMRGVVTVDNDDEHMRNGTWKTNVKLSILDKNGTAIGSFDVPYDMETCEKGISGPFDIPVGVKVSNDVGMKFWKKQSDVVESVWKLHGTVFIQAIKKRILEAD